MSGQVSRGSACEFQADERAGVPWLSWRVQADERAAVAAQVPSIRQMSQQVSRGTAGEYQADEQAGVTWLDWGFSGR